MPGKGQVSHRKGVSKYDAWTIGMKFNKWTVVGPVKMEGEAKVEVECECGRERGYKSCHSIVTGTSKGCLVCNSRQGSSNPTWKGYNNIPGSFIQRYKHKAIKSNKEKLHWDITIKDIDNLYLKQGKKCALTGVPISFDNEVIGARNYRGYSCTASLDRIDSSKGYTKDNIQLVHKDVNIMKNHFDQDYFIEMCKLVVSNNG
jgi:hypothetical protein